MLKRSCLIGLPLLACLAVTTSYADWRRFRGPNGTGISPQDQRTATDWSPTENIQWKTALPGAGVSSPIVVGDKVFVTCYSGYGMDRQNPGEIANLKRHLVCVDRTSGKILWQRTVDATLPEDPYSGIGVTAHGYASHTPVSDGEHVFAFFGKSGLHAYDLVGNKLWSRTVGTGSDDRKWGSSSSPIVFEDLVIVTASAENRSLVGIDKRSGQIVWEEKTDGLANVWGTPTIVKVDDDRSDLVLGVPYEFWGLNPKTGKLRWYADAIETDQYSSSVVAADDVVIGIEGRSGGSVAVRVGGKKNVTESNTVWTGRDSARFGSPLVIDGRIYSFNGDVASCIDATDGSSIFKERLAPATKRGAARADRPEGNGGERTRRGGPAGGQGGRGGGGFGGGFGPLDYASAVAADGKIYYQRGNGTTFVLKVSDQLEVLATNQLSDEKESFGGTPAISDGQLIFRSDKHVYSVSAE